MKGLTSRCITSIVHTEGPAKYRHCAENISIATRKVGRKFKVLTREQKLAWMGALSEVLYSNMGIALEVCCHPFLDNGAVHPDQREKWAGSLLTPEHMRIVTGYHHMETSHCIRTEALSAIGVAGDKRDGSHSLGSKRKGDIRYDLGMCLCCQSPDIGGRVACPHGCVYCQWPHAVEEGPLDIQIDIENPALTPIK